MSTPTRASQPSAISSSPAQSRAQLLRERRLASSRRKPASASATIAPPNWYHRATTVAAPPLLQHHVRMALQPPAKARPTVTLLRSAALCPYNPNQPAATRGVDRPPTAPNSPAAGAQLYAPISTPASHQAVDHPEKLPTRPPLDESNNYIIRIRSRTPTIRMRFPQNSGSSLEQPRRIPLESKSTKEDPSTILQYPRLQLIPTASSREPEETSPQETLLVAGLTQTKLSQDHNATKRAVRKCNTKKSSTITSRPVEALVVRLRANKAPLQRRMV